MGWIGKEKREKTKWSAAIYKAEGLKLTSSILRWECWACRPQFTFYSKDLFAQQTYHCKNLLHTYSASLKWDALELVLVFGGTAGILKYRLFRPVSMCSTRMHIIYNLSYMETTLFFSLLWFIFSLVQKGHYYKKK